jgi:hypothetical protein
MAVVRLDRAGLAAAARSTKNAAVASRSSTTTPMFSIRWLEGRTVVEGSWAARVAGLDAVKIDVAMVRTLGIRRILFAVDSSADASDGYPTVQGDR